VAITFAAWILSMVALGNNSWFVSQFDSTATVGLWQACDSTPNGDLCVDYTACDDTTQYYYNSQVCSEVGTARVFAVLAFLALCLAMAATPLFVWQQHAPFTEVLECLPASLKAHLLKRRLAFLFLIKSFLFSAVSWAAWAGIVSEYPVPTVYFSAGFGLEVTVTILALIGAHQLWRAQVAGASDNPQPKAQPAVAPAPAPAAAATGATAAAPANPAKPS